VTVRRVLTTSQSFTWTVSNVNRADHHGIPIRRARKNTTITFAIAARIRTDVVVSAHRLAAWARHHPRPV